MIERQKEKGERNKAIENKMIERERTHLKCLKAINVKNTNEGLLEFGMRESVVDVLDKPGKERRVHVLG